MLPRRSARTWRSSPAARPDGLGRPLKALDVAGFRLRDAVYDPALEIPPQQPETVDFTSATQIMATACHHIFFFASRASGERWVAKHRGKALLSLDEAFTLARRLNAQVFGPDLTRQRAGGA